MVSETDTCKTPNKDQRIFLLQSHDDLVVGRIVKPESAIPTVKREFQQTLTNNCTRCALWVVKVRLLVVGAAAGRGATPGAMEQVQMVRFVD
jgi:hypothetical protein